MPQPRSRLRNVVFPAIFGVVGLVLLAIPLGIELRYAGATRVPAEVIAVHTVYSDGSPLYSPELRWSDETGEQRTFVPNLRTNPSLWQVGQTVEVRYRPGEPASVQLVEWVTYSILLGLGGVFALVGAITGWALNRRRPEVPDERPREPEGLRDEGWQQPPWRDDRR